MFDYNRAIRLQRELFKQVAASVSSPLVDASRVEYIAGVDASYTGGYSIGVAVLVEAGSLRVLEKTHALVKVHVPYIPGLLAFREAPGIIEALLKLRLKPSLLMVDGHGLTHPRGFGIASHIGLVLGVPSIGVAKSRLYGEVRVEEGVRYIYAHGLRAGAILEHRGGEVYVSVGYAITLDEALKIVRATLREHKLPEPIRLADAYSKELKRALKDKGS